jgi:hypothetical protein
VKLLAAYHRLSPSISVAASYIAWSLQLEIHCCCRLVFICIMLLLTCCCAGCLIASWCTWANSRSHVYSSPCGQVTAVISFDNAAQWTASSSLLGATQHHVIGDSHGKLLVPV